MRSAMILTLYLLSTATMAEETLPDSSSELGLSRLQSLWAEASDGEKWQIVAGLGLTYAPEVMGGDVYKTNPLYSLDIAHRSGFFMGSSKGLGWSYAVNPDWQAAIFLGMSGEREEKTKLTKKQTFKGMGDIKSAGEAGLLLNYTLGDLNLSTQIIAGLADRNRGQQITISADYTAYADENFALMLNSALTASNADYQQRWYGVTAQQAKKSGFKAYQAGSGINLGSVGITGIVPISKALRLISNVSYNQLLGDAADSPLVKDKSSGTFSAFLQYTW